jgi:riboflavin transporter FmnP
MDDALIPKYRHKSTLHLILMICNIALSSFYFGYLNNYFSTLPIETMVAVYHIPLSLGAASGIVNGIAPFSSIIGAAATFQFITQISRRYIF